jgi:hypothetical protein
MQTKTTSVQALDEVVRWRCEQLVGSGFAPALAASVAENNDYDLHALIELVERGCSPELAVRILAPLEEESAA